jgi:dihydrofolate reductase
MRKLIVQEWLSLDGCISDQNDKLDFFAKSIPELYKDPFLGTMLESIDHLIFGRKTYDQFSKLWPTRSTDGDSLAHTINTKKKTVFSKTLSQAPWGSYPDATIEDGDPVSFVREMKTANGKNLIAWGSISLAQLLLKHGLVDELHLFICPSICGNGRKFFSDTASPPTVKFVGSQGYPNGMMRLNYEILNKS